METVHAFAGNPLLPGKRDHMTTEALAQLVAQAGAKEEGGILPLLEGKALVACSGINRQDPSVPAKNLRWKLAWQPIRKFNIASESSQSDNRLDSETAGAVQSSEDNNSEGARLVTSLSRLIYIGETGSGPFFAVDTAALAMAVGAGGVASPSSLLTKFDRPEEGDELGFIDARTLLTVSEWGNEGDMKNLAIVGHARALFEWHKQALFCGRCGSPTAPIEAGQRRECTAPACKTKAYPRTDPVVIMLVIDKERDRVLLGRQSRFVPRMWSCLAGFLEPGESLEEGVRRETREETGIEVGEVVYHSSQPWPVGGGSMSCQLMVGFFAYATSFDIHVDMKELDDARWHSRAQVREALQNMEYKAMQASSWQRIASACAPQTGGSAVAKGETVGPSVKGDQKATGSQESIPQQQSSAPFFPGPYAIAHHLIATWAEKGPEGLLSKV